MKHCDLKKNKVTKTEAMVWNYCNTLKLSLSLYSISNIMNEKKAVIIVVFD